MKTRSVPDIRKGMKWSLMFMIGATLLTASLIAAPRGTEPTTKSSAAEQSSTQTAGQSPAEKYFTDVVLINQNGQKMRLYSDVLKDKVVVINSFFATCQGSCLPLMRNLQKIQTALRNRVGKDLFIFSISVDPTVDTPPRLRDYANKIAAGPGWYFLTGEKANVDFALTKLGQYVDNKDSHLNIFIIGNERTGLWKKAFGLSKSEELIKVVESVLNDRGTSGN
jgi:protein SCO1